MEGLAKYLAILYLVTGGVLAVSGLTWHRITSAITAVLPHQWHTRIRNH